MFAAGLMLYVGEGDHLSRGAIRFTNIDFDLHKVFLNFSNDFLKVNNNSIKFNILLYPDLDINKCVDKWSSELKIPMQNMYKPQVIRGKLKTKKLQYGVGISIISSTVVVKKKILKWLELSKTEKF